MNQPVEKLLAELQRKQMSLTAQRESLSEGKAKRVIKMIAEHSSENIRKDEKVIKMVISRENQLI